MTTDPRPSVPEILASLDEFEVTVEKLVAGGDGFARYQGVPLFVARTAPGDRVRVRLVERRPDYGRAEVVELLAPGPGRREAPCPYFAECGGCDLQHLEEPLQVRYKAEAVRETLDRVGRIALPANFEVVAGEMWGYRLRTTLQLQRGEDGRVRAGYFARGSHRLVPVRQCPILAPGLERILPDLAERLEADPATELPARLDLLCGDDGAVTASPVVGELQHGEVTLAVGDLSYRLDARCFFQAHRGLVERLVSTTVGPWKGERACDLYAGVGLFSLPLARRYRAVTAVEGDRVAARYARTNARRNKLPHVEVVGQAVESWARELPPDLDRVVVDPPRAGLAVPLRRALLDHPAARLTYVSCHPATLARDLRELLAAYRLESLALFDLFPQSGHMESVAQLVRL